MFELQIYISLNICTFKHLVTFPNDHANRLV